MRSKGCPKGAQNAPQKHPRGLLGTQWAHFCGQNAAIESITVFKHILSVFYYFFEGSDPENSMVFTTPNQLSLVSQKVNLLTLFGHLLAPKMVTLGAPWLPEGGQSRSKGAKKRALEKDSKKELRRNLT